jgi:DNA-binding NtrC family response regulator
LRVLETGEMERVGSSKKRHVDVRVISATNADLRGGVAAGQFREDLLFRLNTVEIHLPPLRERPEDIPLLAMHFLGRYTQRYGKRLTGFDAAAQEALRKHTWPGNVRELDHTIERAVLLSHGSAVTVAGLALGGDRDGAASLEKMSLEEVERFLIQKALTRSEGNVSQAAQALGLSRSGLYRRMKKFDL